MDDLCVSVLATWELCLPACNRQKKKFLEVYTRESQVTGKWVYSRFGIGEKERERGCVCI